MMDRVVPKQILVTIASNFKCYRDLQVGIASFAQTQHKWRIDFHNTAVDLIGWIEHTKPDGLILGPTVEFSVSEQQHEALRRVPRAIAVCNNFASLKEFEGIAEVGVDDFQVGVVAAKHFLAKGFEHFGYISSPASAWWAQQRFEGYSSELAAAGHTPSKWETYFSHLEQDNEVSVGPLKDWLLAQPKPLALLACNDARAWDCAQICDSIGLNVPNEVAILGVDNDDVFCRASRPPLSSVVVPWEAMGFQAAGLLDQRLAGKEVKPGLHKVEPTGVLERQSTDVVAVADEGVRTALEFIRQNANRPMGVEDVAEAARVSRRDLEIRFRKTLHRTPLDEIRSAHLERAKNLLATTDMPIDEVAEASGFASVPWFDKVFKQFVGRTPSTFRRQTRG